MNDLSIVRVAGPADRREILRLFAAAHEEHGLFPVDWGKVDWWLDRMLYPEQVASHDTGPRGVIGVIGEPVQLEAIAFLIIGTIWYSSNRHLEELIVYVVPECRGGREHFCALLDWMKAQSSAVGLPLMTGVMSTERTRGKVALYKRHPGLEMIGASFRFNPITGGSSVSVMVH